MEFQLTEVESEVSAAAPKDGKDSKDAAVDADGDEPMLETEMHYTPLRIHLNGATYPTFLKEA